MLLYKSVDSIPQLVLYLLLSYRGVMVSLLFFRLSPVRILWDVTDTREVNSSFVWIVVYLLRLLVDRFFFETFSLVVWVKHAFKAHE